MGILMPIINARILATILLYFSGVTAFDTNDFVSSEITYPINLLTGTGASDHLIFFLDYPCQASGLESTCLKQCQNLGMETGKCSTSISPNACICKASSATALTLNSSVINHYDTVDPNGRNRAGEFVTERVYQINNGWTIMPNMTCSSPDDTKFCNDRCAYLTTYKHGIKSGFCLSFGNSRRSPRPACVCKGGENFSTYNRSTIRIAPFSPPERALDIAVLNTTVYIVSKSCITEHCQKVCKIFNLANGVCKDYFNQPACSCDTGFENATSMENLNIISLLGGINKINGWHLFDLGEQAQCQNTTCKELCGLWNYPRPTETTCFTYESVLMNHCGCRAYKTSIPTPEELASVSTANVFNLALTKFYLVIFLIINCALFY